MNESERLKQAEELAARPYLEYVWQTDEVITFPEGRGKGWLAMAVEVPSGVGQGLTAELALQMAREMRIDLFDHYLEHNLPIPEPAIPDHNIQIIVEDPERSGPKFTVNGKQYARFLE